MKSPNSIDCGKQTLDLTSVQVMAVLNTTPDSFSDGGSYYQAEKLEIDLALRQAQQFIKEGAAIIDVGGESTRPGAAPVSEQQELDRVIPVVEAITKEYKTIVSVDTSTPVVMIEAARAGAGLINDVRALTATGALAAAQKTLLPVCLMHMQGTPETMQQNPNYDNPVRQVSGFLKERVLACEKMGITHDKILLDPGFGFGKTLAHNLTILRDLSQLCALGYPLLVGLSRKSMLGQLLGRDVSERLPGSLALAMSAITRGAHIVRVHDVAATIDVVNVFKALK